jgi:biotin operon repressor
VSCHRIGIMSVNPSWDKGYTGKVADLLAHDYGSWVPHIAQRLGGTSEDVKMSVRVLRRWGWLIDGDNGKGYCFHGWSRWTTAPTDGDAGPAR